MIKRILLISLFLFVPLFSSHSEPLVVGSLQTLTEKNLPLDTDLMYDAFYNNDRIDNKNCNLDMSVLYNLFIKGHMDIPFSAKALLKVCRKTIKASYIQDYEYMSKKCKEECSRYVLDYVKGIVEKSNMMSVPSNKK